MPKAKFSIMKINNSKNASVNGKWKDPGAKLYDQLLNSAYYEGGVPETGKEMDKAINDDKYKSWDYFLKEAYLIAPVDNIKNSPHGITPYSRSGCKYPHHVIKDGQLVPHINGVKVAYDSAFRHGAYNGGVKRHLRKHFKELGLEPEFHHGQLYWNEQAESLEKIEQNFQDISSYIMENLGINLNEPDIPYFENTDVCGDIHYMMEKVHSDLDDIERFVSDPSLYENVGFITLYHGSCRQISVLSPFAPDLGNALQKPGWSIFCWRDKKKAISWAILKALKGNRNWLREKTGATLKPIADWNVETYKPMIIEDDMEKILPHLDTISVYIYSFDVPLSKVGIGNDSTHDEYTIRTEVTPEVTETIRLDENIIKKYTQTVTRDYINQHRDRYMNGEFIGHRGILSYLLTKDYSYNYLVMKQCQDDIKSGKLKVGDNLEEYFRANNIQIHKIYAPQRAKNDINKMITGLFGESFILPDIYEEGIFESIGGVNMMDDDLDWINEDYFNEKGETDKDPSKETKESMPKNTNNVESSKNGVNRKKLYIAFIEWCKEYNPKNMFGNVFDKDAFRNTYQFIPEEMRYFYRLANPMLCVLKDDLTFFAVTELGKLNSQNPKLNEMMIFAATQKDVRVFNVKDKKVYRGSEENGMLKLNETLSDTFDLYIQKMIGKGDILNGSMEVDSSSIE